MGLYTRIIELILWCSVNLLG